MIIYTVVFFLMVYLVGYAAEKLTSHKFEEGIMGTFGLGVTILLICVTVIAVLYGVLLKSL
jgi:hypothetical protein